MALSIIDRYSPKALLAALAIVLTSPMLLVGQDNIESDKHFNARDVFTDLMSTPQELEAPQLHDLWWQPHIAKPFAEIEGLPTDLNTILFLALRSSNRLNIAKQDPAIRETSITEADSAFDWISYANASFADISEPIGNQLTAGGTASRFEDQTGQFQAGLRRTTRSGGLIDISQRFGWQDNNSTFLTPQDQATSRLVLSYTHPLLRGSGEYFNTSLVVLAQLDAASAHSDFLAAIQDELVEITTQYWELYLQRALLAQQIRLYLRTKRTLDTIVARRDVDMQPTQLAATRRALATRRADLIRARTLVTNAETQLRGLVNAPELFNSDVYELLPVDSPTTQGVPAVNSNEIAVALQKRPELQSANYQIQAAQRQLYVAENELQPALNFVSQVYGPGLRGNYNYGGAFVDQFTARPSYSVGLQYEFPLGNRRAKSRFCRRQLELAQTNSRYAQALNIVQTEVDVAVREVNTTYREIIAMSTALESAEAEADTITQRWQRAIDGPGTSSLNLESLLRSLERVTESEAAYANSVVQYNLALVNLKRSTGTLLQSEEVSVTRQCQDGCPGLYLTKGMNIARNQTPQNWPAGMPEPLTMETEELSTGSEKNADRALRLEDFFEVPESVDLIEEDLNL